MNAVETKPSSQVRIYELFAYMKERGWWAGTTLECATPNRDGSKDRLKISYVTSISGPRLDSEGKYDGIDGTKSGIVTFVEYPPGGKVTAFSLNCRDWNEV